MSSANTHVIRRAHDEDAQTLLELAKLDSRALRVNGGSIHGSYAGCPLATPDRPTPHTHGDPLSPTSWPSPGGPCSHAR
jgi:hypothetical protein